MKRNDLLADAIVQEAKGRIAGAIVRTALEHGANLRSAMIMAAGSLEAGEAAWEDMHSVAHMWAARVEFPDILPSAVEILRPGRAPRSVPDLKPFLRRCEEILDQMQARPDLAHPDPWGCSPEVRRELGLKPRRKRPRGVLQ